MGEEKELHYFDDEAAFAGPPEHRRYHQRFAPRPAHGLLGESTPIYFYWPPALPRLQAYHPGLRLILLLRDPAERAWSQWRMESARRSEPLPFARALEREAEEVQAAAPLKPRVRSYVDRGRYREQMERVDRHFPPEQCLYLKSERFRREPAAVMAEVAAFLGLRPFDFDVSARHHAGPDRGPCPAAERKAIQAALAPDIRYVEERLAWDCADWRATEVVA